MTVWLTCSDAVEGEFVLLCHTVVHFLGWHWAGYEWGMIIRNDAQGKSDELYLRKVFSWLARIGACPKFGSRPIGWYQMHAMAALGTLEKTKACGFPVRCKAGMIQYKPTVGNWINLFTASELYVVADKISRA